MHIALKIGQAGATLHVQNGTVSLSLMALAALAVRRRRK
jgi:hypothetical protein